MKIFKEQRQFPVCFSIILLFMSCSLCMADVSVINKQVVVSESDTVFLPDETANKIFSENGENIKSNSAVLINVFIGSTGILVAILAIIFNQTRIFNEIKEFKNIWTFNLPVKQLFLVLITINGIIFYINIIFFTILKNDSPLFIPSLILMLGSFLYLALKIIYLIFRPWGY